MKTRTFSAQRAGFNSLDLLVMLLAVAVVAMVGFAYLRGRNPPTVWRIQCANNLKCVGLSFRLWGGDNGDKYPSQVSTNAGGTMEQVGGAVIPNFMVMSNELGTPKVIICPKDNQRQFAANFGKITDTNLSYFVVPEADEAIPDLWLSGDRNLATNNVTLKPGLFALRTKKVTMGWTSQIHVDVGNIVLANGSVQQPSNRRLHQSATNALAATTNTPFRIAIP